MQFYRVIIRKLFKLPGDMNLCIYSAELHAPLLRWHHIEDSTENHFISSA